MLIIDAHTHIGANLYAGEWATADTDAAAEKYVANLRAAGVDRGFAFTIDGLMMDPGGCNDVLASQRERFPEVIIPWGTVHPLWPEAKIRQELRRCVRELGFVGFKFHPWLQGFSLTAPGMSIVAEECIDMGVPVTFHDGTPFYSTALQVVYYARTFPELKVLSGHGGLAEGWVDVIEPARELPNYWICLSGPTQQGMQALYDQLGPDRLLFGSDGGWLDAETTAFHLRQVRALRAPAEDIEKILGTNAQRLLGLPA